MGEHYGNSMRAFTRAAASKRNKNLAHTAVRTVDRALSKWPEEPLLHHIRARISIDVPEANLQPVPLAEINLEYNPRSISARFIHLLALNRYAKHRRGDIEKLCLELHADGVAHEQEALHELEEVVGPKIS